MCYPTHIQYGNIFFLIHYPTRDLVPGRILRRPKPVEHGVTFFTHQMTWMQKKFQLSGDLNSPSNLQPRDVPREPHTNWDGTFFCVLPYLNTDQWLLVVWNVCFLFHYPYMVLEIWCQWIFESVQIATIKVCVCSTLCAYIGPEFGPYTYCHTHYGMSYAHMGVPHSYEYTVHDCLWPCIIKYRMVYLV